MSRWSAIRFSKGATVALVLATTACAGSSTAAPPPARSPGSSVAVCADPQSAQFDFWVGTWKGTWTDESGTTGGSDVVLRNGCEIDEKFTAVRFLNHDNYSATSRSQWDGSLGKWVQDYRDNVGERSRWLGGFTDGSMTLVGPQVGSRQQRVIWRDIQQNGWTWEYDSSTGGAAWTALLVVTYVRA